MDRITALISQCWLRKWSNSRWHHIIMLHPGQQCPGLKVKCLRGSTPFLPTDTKVPLLCEKPTHILPNYKISVQNRDAPNNITPEMRRHCAWCPLSLQRPLDGTMLHEKIGLLFSNYIACKFRTVFANTKSLCFPCVTRLATWLSAIISKT